MTSSNHHISPTPDLRAPRASENLTRLTIKTGDANCLAHFFPALYQLTLVKDAVEEKVELGFSGSRLLERLARNPGEVVTREELMSHAWSDRVVGQGSLNQQIYTLRQILGDEKAREIIQTLPRRGYQLNPNCVEVSQVAQPPRPTPLFTPVLDVIAGEPTSVELTAGIATANAASDNSTSDSTDNLTASVVAKLAADSPSQHFIVAAPAVTRARISHQSRRPLLTAAAVCTLLAAGLFGHYLGTASHAQAQSLGSHPQPGAAQALVTITYSSQSPDELAALEPAGAKIRAALTPIATQPIHVIIGLHQNLLDLTCLRQNNTARSLHLAPDQALNPEDLRACLL